jgi:uncharacterized protein (TIGR03435 family)
LSQFIFSVTLALAAGFHSYAQNASFEAATIKATAVNPDSFPSFKTDPGRIAYTNVTLRDCIKRAWRLQDSQIDAPKSIDSFRFDLVATAASPTPEDGMRLMLQALLVDRFRMKIREETREIPAFSLVARGKTKLNPSAENRDFATNWAMGRLSFTHVTMEQFAQTLSGYTGRYVSDNTGLTGYYDFSLVISDDPADAKKIMRGNEVGDLIVATLQSQLGLRLEPRKGPVPILIVDQAEKTPLEN